MNLEEGKISLSIECPFVSRELNSQIGDGSEIAHFGVCVVKDSIFYIFEKEEWGRGDFGLPTVALPLVRTGCVWLDTAISSGFLCNFSVL
jgi:hypothetical protein